MPIGEWHPRDDVPKTHVLQDQVEQSDKPEAKIIRRWLEEGHLPGTHADYPPYDLVPFPLIRAVMRDGHKFATDKSIAMALRKIAVRKYDQRMFVAMAKNGEPIFDRCVSYQFEPLSDARQKFDPNAEWDEAMEWVPEREKGQPVKSLNKETGKALDVTGPPLDGDSEVPF